MYPNHGRRGGMGMKSSKEQDVLARQRRLAAAHRRANETGSASAAGSASAPNRGRTAGAGRKRPEARSREGISSAPLPSLVRAAPGPKAAKAPSIARKRPRAMLLSQHLACVTGKGTMSNAQSAGSKPSQANINGHGNGNGNGNGVIDLTSSDEEDGTAIHTNANSSITNDGRDDGDDDVMIVDVVNAEGRRPNVASGSNANAIMSVSPFDRRRRAGQSKKPAFQIGRKKRKNEAGDHARSSAQSSMNGNSNTNTNTSRMKTESAMSVTTDPHRRPSVRKVPAIPKLPRKNRAAASSSSSSSAPIPRAGGGSRSTSPALSSMASSTHASITPNTAIARANPTPGLKKTSSLIDMMKAAANNRPTQGGSGVAGGQFGYQKHSDLPGYMNIPVKISPEDFWKSIRDWNFAADLATQIEHQNMSEEEKDEKLPKRKPLPNTFLNHRQYIAAWAPLCKAEARAQLLSEISTEVNQHNHQQVSFVLVSVDTTTKGMGSRRDRDMQMDAMDLNWCNVQVATKFREDGRGMNLLMHDVCCLIPVHYKKVLSRLIRGLAVQETEDMLEEMVIVGHTEISRKDADGLILKISKERWARIGQPEMFLLKIGGNITALREFTALCNVNRLPLRKYMMGLHLPGKVTPEMMAERQLVSRESRADLLEQMGGAKALGSGFTNYAKNKFNPSQLAAIAAAARGYGDEGFTLIKGPPGSGKTTTLVAVLNSLHIRQYKKYYDEVERIIAMPSGNQQLELDIARKSMPRLLVCAPSNAAVDNIILKIMEDGFLDRNGKRYNPSMIRLGARQSLAVKPVSLEARVDKVLNNILDQGLLDSTTRDLKRELRMLEKRIAEGRRRLAAIQMAAPGPLSRDWEIKIDEDTFEESGRAYFWNVLNGTTTYSCPPPPGYNGQMIHPQAMPEYKQYASRTVSYVEKYFRAKQRLEQCGIVQNSIDNGSRHASLRQAVENHLLNTVHVVMTTLGTAGSRALEGTHRFEVVVVDEAAQSVEPSTLAALHLGSQHAVLVGDPQQLPATVFNVAGRGSKFDRSLFQRLEEAGHEVFMLNEQYRMHPKISRFPRERFYGGNLMDGPNVTDKKYGNPVVPIVAMQAPNLQPFTILNLESKEERGGTSLSNTIEAHLAVFLFESLRKLTRGLSARTRVAVITPYSQQAALLKQSFHDALGEDYEKMVEINTVDAFQGREANIVIFSAVRAGGVGGGIGFLSDIRRMNVALTRAKHFLFVIARCDSITVNPYWQDLVKHARETKAVVKVPLRNGNRAKPAFGELEEWQLDTAAPSVQS